MPSILVIDDEHLLREEIVEILQFEGYETLDAPNGRVGVRLAKNHLPDLIVCDISMPEMDGYGVLYELRADPCTNTTPVIFLTARADRTQIRYGMELGADDYLTKPFTSSELLGAIFTRLDRQREVRELHTQDAQALKQQLLDWVQSTLSPTMDTMRFVQNAITQQVNTLTPPELTDLLNTLALGTAQIKHVVDLMTYLSRIEAGQITPESIQAGSRPFQLWQFIPTVLDLARQYAGLPAEHYLETRLYQDNANLSAEPDSLRFALAEIVAGVLTTATASWSINLTQWAEDGSVWIEVAGTGVNPSDRNPIDPVQTGSQRGLTAAEYIIRLHNGSLSYTTEAGLKFLIRLPVASNPKMALPN
jgi:two-component system, sensor histidine kinase and response regulator